MEQNYLRNKKGLSVQDRLKQDIEYAKNIKDEKNRKQLAHKALGAADFAVEFGLITYKEWDKHIDEIFKIA